MTKYRTLQVLSHMILVHIENFGLDDNLSYIIALKDLNIDLNSDEEKIAKYIWDNKDTSIDEIYSTVREFRLDGLLHKLNKINNNEK